MTGGRFVAHTEPGKWGRATGFGRALISAQRDRLMALYDDPGTQLSRIRCKKCRRQIGNVARHPDLGLIAQWNEKNAVRERAHIANGGNLTKVRNVDPNARLRGRDTYETDVIAMIGNRQTPPTLAAWCPRCAEAVTLNVNVLIGAAAESKDINQ